MKNDDVAHMNLLALDTSTTRASVALTVSGVLYSETEDHVSEHARCLLPMIERVLKQADMSWSALDGVVFGRGPGSFTGLRIACSVAKGLAYAHDLPVFPVSGLEAIAYQVYASALKPKPNTHVLAMIDARMQQVYWATYNREGAKSAEQVTAASHVRVDADAPFIIAGVGLSEYMPQLPVFAQMLDVREQLVYPEASAMIGLVQAGRVSPITAAEAAPVYIRNQVTQEAPRG